MESPDVRDGLAEKRDYAAAERDIEAAVRDRIAGKDDPGPHGDDRRHAASDRMAAMRDRQEAARDREIAAHERAELAHARAAHTHEDAAKFWDLHGDPEKADSERRLAQKDWDGAELERLRGERDRARPSERDRELGEDRQVGVEPDPLKAPDT